MRAKKHLGQHFLRSVAVLEKIIAASELNPRETVLEIGPGEGVLTERLLAGAHRIVAVEKDRALADALQQRFATEVESGSLVVVANDILKTNLHDLGLRDHEFVVVANIPYYITGEILRRLLSGDTQPSRAVLIVQIEVAQRISRSPKESLLSLSVKAYGTPLYVTSVPRGAFSPAPAVDSAILRIDAISRDFFADVPSEAFFSVLKRGFGKKRKQLLGNLSSVYPREIVADIFTSLALPRDVRAEDVPLAQWKKLVKELARTNPR